MAAINCIITSLISIKNSAICGRDFFNHIIDDDYCSLYDDSCKWQMLC